MNSTKRKAEEMRECLLVLLKDLDSCRTYATRDEQLTSVMKRLGGSVRKEYTETTVYVGNPHLHDTVAWARQLIMETSNA